MRLYRINKRQVDRRLNSPIGYCVDSDVFPWLHYMIDGREIGIINTKARIGGRLSLDECRERLDEITDPRIRAEVEGLVNDGKWLLETGLN